MLGKGRNAGEAKGGNFWRGNIISKIRISRPAERSGVDWGALVSYTHPREEDKKLLWLPETAQVRTDHTVRDGLGGHHTFPFGALRKKSLGQEEKP